MESCGAQQALWKQAFVMGALVPRPQTETTLSEWAVGGGALGHSPTYSPKAHLEFRDGQVALVDGGTLGGRLLPGRGSKRHPLSQSPMNWLLTERG